MTDYRVGRGVRWSVGRVTLTLADAKGNVRTLRYPEAAVFDLVSRGRPFAKVVSLTAHILSLDAAGAEALVRSTLEEWADGGFLERV